MDVTWDDFEQVILHGCFAMTLEEVSRDHFAEEEFILPDCTHAQMDYYAIGHGTGTANVSNNSTAADLAACFGLDEIDSDGAVFGCELRFDGEQFFSWLDKNFRELRTLLGLSYATEVYYYNMYDVYYLQLVDPNYQMTPLVSAITLQEETVTLTGPGTQYQLRLQIQSDSVWTPALVYESSDASVATVNEQGLVTAVSEGTAVITASNADGSISAHCTITVEQPPAHVHTMRLFTTKMPTCLQDGHETYYLCTGCGRRFADESGTVEYTEPSVFVLPATGHVNISWVKRFDFHVQQCECGEQIGKTQGVHADADADGLCDACSAAVPVADPDSDASSKERATPGWLLPVAVGAGVVLAAVLFVVIRRRRRGY